MANRILIGFVGALFMVLLVLGVVAIFRGPQAPDATIPPELESMFRSELIAEGIERVGQPIEGFDASLLILAFPGLQEADFNGVRTGITEEEGMYSYIDGELRWERTKQRPITSGEKTVSEEGYRTLLSNISERLGIAVRTEEAVRELIGISGALRAPPFFYIHPPTPKLWGRIIELW